jgi:hypothetical protein
MQVPEGYGVGVKGPLTILRETIEAAIVDGKVGGKS